MFLLYHKTPVFSKDTARFFVAWKPNTFAEEEEARILPFMFCIP